MEVNTHRCIVVNDSFEDIDTLKICILKYLKNVYWYWKYILLKINIIIQHQTQHWLVPGVILGKKYIMIFEMVTFKNKSMKKHFKNY